METFVAHMRAQWVPAHRRLWQQSMERVAGPLMNQATASLTQADVLSVIQPIWETTNETARRVLGRIEQTIEHAMAVDPARFGGSNPCACLLSQNRRSPASDLERDRRQPVERAGGAHEVRGCAHDPAKCRRHRAA
jgi:hypothetical protein